MLRVLGLIVLLSACAASFLPAAAQDEDVEAEQNPRDRGAWGFYAGFLQGNELTNESLFGTGFMSISSRPELDDAATIGGVFSVQTADSWILEIRLALSSTKILDAPDDMDPGVNPNREIDAELFYLDVGLLPTWTWGDFTLGVPFGIGWAGLSEDGVISPFIPGRTFTLQLKGGDGAQYFVGVQGRWRTGDGWSLFADARVHRFHRLTNVLEQNVQSPEISFGFLRHF